MILDMIIKNRKRQLKEFKEKTPLSIITEKAFAHHMTHKTADFAESLRGFGLSVIAEVKKASPSKGIIKEDFEPVSIAREYEYAGANAISVLTEETYFKGCGEYLTSIRHAVRLPLLRKDFIFDEWQICEASLLGADAVLLIATVLDLFELKKYIAIAEMLGMQCLVEARNEEQIQLAIRAGAKIIGVNNRNLNTFEVDLKTTEKLRRLVPSEIVFVSESGIAGVNDMRYMEEVGADAVLVGEVLMRAPSITEKLRELKGYKNAIN
jgi:indole-3-glycerol phosphate synthase